MGIVPSQRDMLCEDLAHATEQLNTLTQASEKHLGLLQSAQEEVARKEALIQELQHEVRCRGLSLRMGPGGGQEDCMVVEVVMTSCRG